MKTKTKVLIVLMVTILATLIMGCTKVGATTEVTEETVEELVTILPSKIQLNLKESEYEKAFNVILPEIEKALSNNNIKYTIENNLYGVEDQSLITLQGKFEGISLRVSGVSYYRVEDIKKIEIDIEYNKSKYKYKQIELVYNNSNNYNATDKEIVKNLKIESPKYYEVPVEDGIDDMEGALKQAKKYYTNLIKDNTISIKVFASAGGVDGFSWATWHKGTYLGIFRNDILYDVRLMGEEITVPVINVPNTINDMELNDYVTDILMKYFSKPSLMQGEDWLKSVNSITKGATYRDKEIVDGYTVKCDWANDGLPYEYVIIRREKSSIPDTQNIVERTDEGTNVKMESSTDIIPANTQLVVENLTSGNVYDIVENSLGKEVSKFTLYDITLKENGEIIQPNGNVKISIPIPADYNTSRLAVYRIEEDGTKTEYNITIDNGYIIFETDHFSNYVVAEKTGVTTQKPSDGELDETPKTGVTDMMYFILPIAILSATGIILLKKKETK